MSVFKEIINAIGHSFYYGGTIVGGLLAYYRISGIPEEGQNAEYISILIAGYIIGGNIIGRLIGEHINIPIYDGLIEQEYIN